MSISSIFRKFISSQPYASERDKAADEALLIKSAAIGDVKTIKKLIRAGVDINAKSKVSSTGATAVMYAAEGGHSACLQLLITEKADLNAKDNDGATAAMWAAGSGQTECLQLLVDANVDLSAKSNNGLTALMLASGNGFYECFNVIETHLLRQRRIRSPPVIGTA